MSYIMFKVCHKTYIYTENVGCSRTKVRRFAVLGFFAKISSPALCVEIGLFPLLFYGVRQGRTG